MFDEFWLLIAKSTIRGLGKAKVKSFIISKDNVVKNFVLKFSQFGIKCSAERERVNLFLVNGCLRVLIYEFLLSCRRSLFFAQKRVLYLFRGDIRDKDRPTV